MSPLTALAIATPAQSTSARRMRTTTRARVQRASGDISELEFSEVGRLPAGIHVATFVVVAIIWIIGGVAWLTN